MSRVINRTLVIEPETARGTCEICQVKNQELRPYGPGGSRICVYCGLLNAGHIVTAIRNHLLGGVRTVVDNSSIGRGTVTTIRR